MPNLNRIMLMGHLTRDPSLKEIASGTNVANFGIAVNRRWNKKDGTKTEETLFIDCSAFNRLAELIYENLSKGDPIYIDGYLKTNKWKDKEGNEREKNAVIVENMQFIGPKNQERNKPVKAKKDATVNAAIDDEDLLGKDMPF